MDKCAARRGCRDVACGLRAEPSTKIIGEKRREHDVIISGMGIEKPGRHSRVGDRSRNRNQRARRAPTQHCTIR